MPHQCVRCNTFYEDGSKEILTGCKCGSRLFFFIKKEAMEKAKEVTVNLTPEDKKQIEADVFDLIGDDSIDDNQPVILDFESIRCMKPGKFEIDLVKIFKEDPVIYKVGDGKYVIDIAETFKNSNKFSPKVKKAEKARNKK